MNIDYFKGDKVISLRPRRQKAHFPALSQVEAYWEGLRNGRPMPARAEVDPRGISDALEYAFVREKIAPGMARLRVAGHHLNDLLGMEVRGMPFSALFLPEARGKLQEAMETAFTAPASM
ncbi:MAG TPA: PAS domain-containing protein, partial [Aliiroseovarius sp.]|nr:PAS domain-containing protein [Aliiroseovarius sp.]